MKNQSIAKFNISRYILGLILIALFLSCTEESPEKPNIILIMGDDIGFSDIGAYGGEIETPNLNRLAKDGLKFRTFYNMAKCNPTRSSLLTGLYTGGNGAVHLAQLTKSAGYQNIMSGKEHFDPWVPDYCNAENVFDKSFYFWATTEYFLPPTGEFREPFYLQGKELKSSEIEFEKAPMYKTDFITDYALKWLDTALQNKNPFFLYLPYHAAHYPLQARPEDIKKYRGKYLKGWDSLRKERFARMQQLGIIPENTKLSPAEKNLNTMRGPLISDYTDYYRWDTLSLAKQDSLDLEMSVYAAIIDRMDQNIGRVIRKLENAGQLDNTLIIYLNDNGACPFYTNKITDVPPGPYDSFWSLRTTWSNLSNTPYRQYKQSGYEGGSNTPFIAHWPNKIAPNSVTSQPGHVVDLAPTFLDILEISYPDSVNGYPSIPLDGASLMPIFNGKSRLEPKFFISGMESFRMFRKGNEKIVRMNSGDWQLYDLESDPSELNDLASERPLRVKQLKIEYQATKIGSLPVR